MFLQKPAGESKIGETKTEIVMAFFKHRWKELLIPGIVIFLISIGISIGGVLNGKSQVCYGNTGSGVSRSGVQYSLNFFLKMKCFKGLCCILKYNYVKPTKLEPI